MTSSRALFLAFTLTLLTSATFASNHEAEAAALIGRAKQLSDIRADGAPPFRLKLDFKIIKDDGAVTDGTYTERWVSKAQWRRETVLGDFRRIQIATGNRKVWLFDSSTVVPQQVAVGAIPHLSDVGGLRPEAWKSQKDREVNGVGVRCLENNLGPLGATWAVCFDKTSGTLTAEISPLGVGAGGGERVCLHSDYQKFGEYMVARSYECDENKHPKIEARMVELATDPAQDPTVFVPPEGAKESVNCLGPVKPPTVVHQMDPTPPRSSSGTNIVTMSVVVGTDGKPHDLRVTSAPNRDYDQAALAAVQQWRFKPATCDGEPMETQIAVETKFHRY
jgi:TonB family protein